MGFIIRIIRIIGHLWTYEAGGRKKLNGNKSNRAVVWLTNSAHRFLMVYHSTVSQPLQASVDSLVKLSTFFCTSLAEGVGTFKQSLVLHLLEAFAYETTTLGPTEIV